MRATIVYFCGAPGEACAGERRAYVVVTRQKVLPSETPSETSVKESREMRTNESR